MRTITSHIVNPKTDGSRVTVVDEPGHGGASHHYVIEWDEDKNTGFRVDLVFQNGPISEAGHNGLADDALLAIAIDRLQGFQAGRYACRENAIALTHLETALMWLQARTRARMARGVEGTHAV